MCRRLQSGDASPKENPWPAWCQRESCNTLSSTDFIGQRRDIGTLLTRRPCGRQAGCITMKTTEKHPRHQSLPAQIERAVRAAEDKKANDLLLLDLRKAAAFTDYFLICSGANARQIRAIADAIVDALSGEGAKPAHIEGYDRSEWVLLDYFDFIVHIFAAETRVFYGLERLWGSAERIEVPTGTR